MTNVSNEEQQIIEYLQRFISEIKQGKVKVDSMVLEMQMRDVNTDGFYFSKVPLDGWILHIYYRERRK